MFTPFVKRRKLTAGTTAYPKAAGFTVLAIDARAGECLSVRTRDLHAWSAARKVSLDEAKRLLVADHGTSSLQAVS